MGIGIFFILLFHRILSNYMALMKNINISSSAALSSVLNSNTGPWKNYSVATK